MVPSSTLCRTQESLHLRRAEETQLENVRLIATSAALAWGKEAVTAEWREGRRLRASAEEDRIEKTRIPESDPLS